MGAEQLSQDLFMREQRFADKVIKVMRVGARLKLSSANRRDRYSIKRIFFFFLKRVLIFTGL